MSQIKLIKVLTGILAPLDPDDEDALNRVKIGGVIECEFVNKRNPLFMRKFFALLRVGYDLWEPPELEQSSEVERHIQKYGVPEKQFERYRHDVTIMAGYYDTVFDLQGRFKLVAKSISFGSMDEDEFSRLYSNTIDVILKSIPHGYTVESINTMVERVMDFT